MAIDHRFIREMVETLQTVSQGTISEPERERVRRLLCGLQALLEVHFTKENEAYVPLLNRLSPAERRELYARLAGGDHHHHEEPQSMDFVVDLGHRGRRGLLQKEHQ